jgi:hypothetical protein
MWTQIFAIGAAFVLAVVALIFFGMRLDARKELERSLFRPQMIEVILRHDKKAWLLPIMRNFSGEIYAPEDPQLRKLKPVDLRQVPQTVLGCPKFILKGDRHGQLVFELLGREYVASLEE